MKLSMTVAILGCLLLAGCAGNKYVETYKAENQAAAPQAEDFKPRVRRSNDLDTDVADLRAEGYTVLGSSDFTAELEPEDGMFQQAKTTGATLILVKNTFVETRTLDKTVYAPNSTTENQTRVNRSSTSTVPSANTSPPAGTRTTAPRKGSIPHTVTQEIYHQQAVFLAR